MRSQRDVAKDEHCDGDNNNSNLQLRKPYQKAEKPIIGISTSFLCDIHQEPDNRKLLYAAQHSKRQIKQKHRNAGATNV
jgi:hypothetical protein